MCCAHFVTTCVTTVYKYILHVLKNNYVASQVIGVITIEFGFRTVCRQLFRCGVYGSNTGGHHVRQYPVVGAHSAGTVDSGTKNVRTTVTCSVCYGYDITGRTSSSQPFCLPFFPFSCFSTQQI